MATFSTQSSSRSPVLTMSPHSSRQQSMPSANPPLNTAPPQSRSIGRKRSRDEASSNLEPDAPVTSSSEDQDAWVYGPGMVLIKTNKGYVAEASSQSGTWLEEKAAREEVDRQKQCAEILKTLRSHKSQRLDSARDPPPTFAPTIGDAVVSTIADTNTGPVVDDFTLHLGIGWRRISDDIHIQAACRGWARYIENHYTLSNVEIRLESRGLQSYLVEATEGFFLFAEDLRQARFVSGQVGGVLRNLQSSPPVFDNPHTLYAAESPKPHQPSQISLPVDTAMSVD